MEGIPGIRSLLNHWYVILTAVAQSQRLSAWLPLAGSSAAIVRTKVKGLEVLTWSVLEVKPNAGLTEKDLIA